ncbi:MAG: type II secretion system protein [Planctomycetota bacterium]
MKRMTTFRRSGHSRRGGFSLVELLFVIGIIALLVGILVPSLQQVRRQALRLRCGSNVREIAKACKSYMMEARMHRENVGGQMPCGEADAAPFDPGYGNVMGLRLLLRYQFVSPSALVCPTAARELDHTEAKMEKQDGQIVLANDSFVNGAGQTTCSYGYLSMMARDKDARKIRRRSTIHQLPSSMVVVGDSNPRVDWNGTIGSNKEENSENHRGLGQNVGLLNESVEWIDSPTKLGDDIYSSSGGSRSFHRETVEDVLLIP